MASRAARSSNTAQGRRGILLRWRRSGCSPWAGTAIHRASPVHTDEVDNALAPARAHSPRICAPVLAATARAPAQHVSTPHAYFSSSVLAPQPEHGRRPVPVLALAHAPAYTPLLPQGAARPAPCAAPREHSAAPRPDVARTPLALEEAEAVGGGRSAACAGGSARVLREARSALCAVLGPPHPSPQLVRLSVTHWINGNIACCLSHTDISTTTQIDIKRPPACTHCAHPSLDTN